jgi:hypothetical protein
MWTFIPIIGRIPIVPIRHGLHRLKQSILRRKDPRLAAEKEAAYQQHHNPNDHSFVRVD